MGEQGPARMKGFSYTVDDAVLEEYGRWPLERRLEWLQSGLDLRALLPPEIIERQEKFRRGEI